MRISPATIIFETLGSAFVSKIASAFYGIYKDSGVETIFSYENIIKMRDYAEANQAAVWENVKDFKDPVFYYGFVPLIGFVALKEVFLARGEGPVKVCIGEKGIEYHIRYQNEPRVPFDDVKEGTFAYIKEGLEKRLGYNIKVETIETTAGPRVVASDGEGNAVFMADFSRETRGYHGNISIPSLTPKEGRKLCKRELTRLVKGLEKL